MDMIRLKSMRPTLVVLLAAVLIVAAGGAAVASNMGFKFNKPIVLGPVTGFVGHNMTAIPYHNPYGTWNGFCLQTGLVSTGITAHTEIRAFNYNVEADTTVTARCGTTAAANQTLIKGKSIEIIGNAPGSPTSIIIVGSHDPGHPVTLNKFKNFWFSVPYHTTAVTSNDLCTQAGMTSTGLTRAQIQRLNATAGVFQTASCGSTTGVFNLVLGEGVMLRETVKASTMFVPSHF
jgi:hypothetical protein